MGLRAGFATEFPDGATFVPGAVDLGALGDGLRAAVVAVEQAVERVHGRGAHAGERRSPRARRRGL